MRAVTPTRLFSPVERTTSGIGWVQAGLIPGNDMHMGGIWPPELAPVVTHTDPESERTTVVVVGSGGSENSSIWDDTSSKPVKLFRGPGTYTMQLETYCCMLKDLAQRHANTDTVYDVSVTKRQTTGQDKPQKQGT